MAKIQQFEYFELDSNKVNNTKIPISTSPYVIGEVFIDEVIPGDVIWINAVIGGTDNELIAASISFKLCKGNVLNPEKEVYLAVEEIGKEGDGDVTNVPLSHVDVIEKNDTNVKYILTVQRTNGSTNVFVDGPITLTAARIRQ